ncbi:MAG: imidazole glycerol phosphate synthase subunit HisH [Methanoregulaceae archaeon]|nr:imidazole glycerol phosphate synthase subunit HisH [Methanoregulaceae archaeon]
MGNLRSVERAVAHLGFTAVVQDHLGGATRLIIPGVGAFGAAMAQLEPRVSEIRAFARDGHPLLGICLGQQLLFGASDEGARETPGLGLLAGRVRYFPADLGVKVPHVGWNSLQFRADSRFGAGFPQGGQVYFVHSLYTECEDQADVAATCEHGIEFAAAVERGNVWGAQFHPEKSGDLGLALLRNFLEFNP